MYLPDTFAMALLLTILSALFWGSWANTYKGTRGYPFALFYWDYIIGVVLCALGFALTLGNVGGAGESFVANLRSADAANCLHALAAGAIFNVANLLLIAALDMVGLAVAFPIAIGIAVVEGVVLSYIVQPKGNAVYLGLGVALAIAAVLFDADAYRRLNALRRGRAGICVGADAGKSSGIGSKAILVSVVSGLLMGGFAPLVTRSMTHGHALTPYSVAVLFSLGALACCFVANTYWMKHPITGPVVSLSQYLGASTRNHLVGILGGIAWGIGGCFNFIAAGFVGVPISYAIGQSAPLIAAAWGVLVWREFDGAPRAAWVSLALMFALYVSAVGFIAFAYNG